MTTLIDEKERYLNQPKSQIYDNGQFKRRHDSYAMQSSYHSKSFSYRSSKQVEDEESNSVMIEESQFPVNNKISRVTINEGKPLQLIENYIE